MSKSVLEKRIKEKAEERFKDEYREFIELIKSHPFGKLARVKINDKLVPLANSGGNYGIFNHYQEEQPFRGGEENSFTKQTNYHNIKEKMVEKYEKEETDNLLKELESISYIFKNNGGF